MRSATAVAAFCLALLAAPAHAQTPPPQPTPPPEIAALSAATIAATNADDATKFAGLYTDDAVVVDENPPFAWHGADAGAQWWHVTDAIIAKLHLKNLYATPASPSEFAQSDTDAYMIVPVTLGGSANGKTFTESGTLTYTFHKTPAGWKISSQVWTTKP
ncbi:MAG: nuclear transport factor 2 family protein [Candidatus Eremiobacteraeota bacterium]|nr:nuclear transport factor 2 family protein [Candidatus Eremiobacteraeota bacterium]